MSILHSIATGWLSLPVSLRIAIDALSAGGGLMAATIGVWVVSVKCNSWAHLAKAERETRVANIRARQTATKQLEAQYEKLTSDVRATKEELASVSDALSAARSALDSVTNEAQSLRLKRDAYMREIQSLQEELAFLQKDVEEKQKTREEIAAEVDDEPEDGELLDEFGDDVPMEDEYDSGGVDFDSDVAGDSIDDGLGERV